MNQEEIVDYWKVEAKESLTVATHLFEKKDYSYALFFGHLAVEKIIKAIFVQNVSPDVPRTHNLLRLAKAAQVKLTEQQEFDLVRITAFNLEARYPDYKRKFRKKCTAGFSKTEIQTIKEVFSWLKSML
ncbi:MAG: HEPN domain-containing protein [Thermodesulfobacteriota bacterium]|nr:HEPN domain-containing protein [Thermodesulfobacteriota bacterium]